MTQIIQDTIDTEGRLKPGFSGIGRLRGKKEYTPAEKTVLEYFFTNTHSNIYCATDNMPNELWALVMGQYARSNLTARDRLLKLFKDMHEKGQGESVERFAEMIRSGKDMKRMLEGHLKKAGKFVETWGVKYGHASLRDSGVIRICFEGVSQRATKFLESAREGAYQEQSTRALPFKTENLGVPYEVRGTRYEQKMKDLNEKTIGLYEKIYKKLKVHLKEKFSELRQKAEEELKQETGDEQIELSDREWESIIKGKAFDVARYLLPQNMTTSLGVTLNTRRFQDKLTAWQSSDIQEIQLLGVVAQAESKKISPTLMKYGNKSEHKTAIHRRLEELNRKYLKGNNPYLKGTGLSRAEKLTNCQKIAEIGEDPLYIHYDCRSRVVEAPEDLQELVLASILLSGSDGSKGIEEIKEIVKKMSFEQKREIAEAVLKDRERHETFYKGLECGSIVFERIYDIGAFRDLQRQRGDRQQYNRYSVIGYNMPKEIEEIGYKEEFEKLMEEVKELYDEMIEEGMRGAAEYVPLMANVLRHVTTKDAAQCFYEAQLRTQPAGIDSYRSIAQQEIEQVLELMPVFKGLVPYDERYYELGRLPETVKGKIRRYKAKRARS